MELLTMKFDVQLEQWYPDDEEEEKKEEDEGWI
jgi:hypothetical protein